MNRPASSSSDEAKPLLPQDWEELAPLLDTLLDAPLDRRPDLLAELSGGDASRRARLERLIAECELDTPFLNRPAAERFTSLFADDAEMPLPDVLGGRYRLEREVGRGGMARVYLAHDVKHSRDVAVKVIRPDLAASLGRDRFLREIAIAARLGHPNIVPLYDSGDAGGLLYFVMPYEEGPSLRARLEEGGALSVTECLSILRDVARALAYAHERGVVHRDVKPENVMMSGGAAVVTDFGISKAVSAAQDDAPAGTITQDGTRVGTPAYMAPEQAVGDPATDHRADIYSFGCLAYELFAGRPPFHDLPPHEILAAHVGKKPAALATVSAGVPESVSQLVARCLEKSPSARPQSAQELLTELEATRSDSGDVFQQRRRMSRPALLASAIVGLILIGGVGYFLSRDATAAKAAREVTLAVLPLVRDGDSLARVAVLPFANLSHDARDAAIVDGLTAEMISVLSRLGHLRVIAPTSAFAFRNTDASVRTIADSLRVSWVLDGGVQKADSQLRVDVRLVDPRDGSTRWAETYDRPARDIFTVESEIAHAVARELDVQLGGSPMASIRRGAPHDIAAYELYLRGTDPTLTRSDSGTRAGIAYFRQAIALDPGYAAAYAGLARLLVRGTSDDTTPRRVQLARAEQAARKALALDDSLAEAHAALAMVTTSNLVFASSERELQRAVALDPGNSRYHEGLVQLYVLLDRPADALREARQALEVDPLSATANAEFGRALGASGRCDEALAQLAKLRTLRPPLQRATSIRAVCYARKQMWAEAIAELQAKLKSGSAGPLGEAMLGYMLARAGRTNEARQLLAVLLDRARRRNGALAVATVYAGLGETDRAFQWLDTAVANRSLMPELLPLVLDALHSDPRVERLRERLGIQKR